ncbi:EscU/YscU/HrcU family type III secretion system export apparatus switch protein [Anaeromyxobacter paludicola]|uniref:Flagellar biosynthesis protein FlhB n=1 Tax=Anaeromyxobacter paludicola TaxID=2918171 RepID=A0ABN6N480_9BACT|nr:EscU/YscU/HrcU family type III secretion system export apparatus switch protein [Anaeromyxobacter paludicola]BDG07997.1 flagellar biosynthesis protein FlhB [Anaeromyxobacter paludicola]
MSGESDGRTEKPTGRKLQQAWGEGQIPISRDAAMVAGIAAGTAALGAMAAPLRNGLTSLFAEALRSLPTTPFSALPRMAVGPILATLAVSAACALATATGLLVQTRGGFWPDLALPDLSKVFQAGKLTRMFGKDFLIELGIAAVKVVALAGSVYGALRAHFLTIDRLLGLGPGEQLAQAFGFLSSAAIRVLAVLVVIGGLDVAVTRYRFTDRLKMTKEEVKQEAREEDGDPHIKGKRKKRHRELARGRARVEVPRADALLVNPTHIAIALRYRRDEGGAPRVTAKGKGKLAEYMRELARENGIPIVQDIPLARLLYRKVKVGAEIPAQTYKAVAAVLAFVYRLTGRTGAGARP